MFARDARFSNDFARHSFRTRRCTTSGVKAANPRVSFADLERWPDDGRRYELYDGEVYRLAGARFALASTAGPADRVQSSLLPDLSLVPRSLIPGE